MTQQMSIYAMKKLSNVPVQVIEQIQFFLWSID